MWHTGVTSAESLAFCNVLYTVQSIELEISTHNYLQCWHTKTQALKDLLHQIPKLSHYIQFTRSFQVVEKNEYFFKGSQGSVASLSN